MTLGVFRTRLTFHESGDVVNPTRLSGGVAIHTGKGFQTPPLVKVVSKTYFFAATAEADGSDSVLLGNFQR